MPHISKHHNVWPCVRGLTYSDGCAATLSKTTLGITTLSIISQLVTLGIKDTQRLVSLCSVSRYAKCRSGECRWAECRGALRWNNSRPKGQQTTIRLITKVDLVQCHKTFLPNLQF
jgi:hypothetical protein